jgi:hypothetical protein
MKLIYLTHFILNLNAAIDTGKYQDISLAKVGEHIEKGDLLRWLKKRLGNDIDLSLLMPEEDLGAPNDIEDKTQWIKNQVDHSKRAEIIEDELIEGLQSIYNVYGADGKRKWGVKNSGLCLLIAWATTLIDQKK